MVLFLLLLKIGSGNVKIIWDHAILCGEKNSQWNSSFIDSSSTKKNRVQIR